MTQASLTSADAPFTLTVSVLGASVTVGLVPLNR